VKSRRQSADRRATILDELAKRFGTTARSPVDFIEQNWTLQRYWGGGVISHAPRRVLAESGPALREPCGRIQWAGTDGSAVMNCWVDGAVCSGERAAAEVMQRESVSVA
jgi:monoamine oxidase